MKMVKSLLLGAAAGFVAVAGAQAADLPVKARPVQYVKICSLYGAGFFYIPGTDTCLKIGGYARSEWNWNANGSFTPQVNQNYNRLQNELISRSRFLATFDVRSQTEYGTLRAYTRVGFQWTTGDLITGGSSANNGLASGGLYVDRAFIQLGGWTFGKTESFYNFSISDFGYTNSTQLLWNDTGGSGVPVLAYTAQFGNGLSATIAIEDHMENVGPDAAISPNLANTGTVATSPVGLLLGGAAAQPGGLGTGNQHSPDLVGNLRIDQAWGSAQIEGALVNNQPGYYSTTLGLGSVAHPSDKLSGAIGGGIKVNLPMLGKGDSIGIAANYCSGASHYCSNNATTDSASTNQLSNSIGTQVPGNPALFALTQNGTTGGGQLWDGFYNNTAAGPNGSVELSQTWNVNGGIQHVWNSQWMTSLWGAYLHYKANSNTVDTVFCPTQAIVAGGFQGPGCLDFSAYQIGSRTVWTPVTNLDISLEAMYSRVNNSILQGSTSISAATSAATAGTVPSTFGNAGVWSGILRFQRNFWP